MSMFLRSLFTCGDRPSARRTWLGFRRSGIIELALFLAIAFAADAVFFDGTRFWSWAPHPFGYMVLLIAIQYGTYEGLLAALAASIALLAWNLPVREVTQDYYAWLYETVARPMWWTIIALAAGELRRRQLREKEALEQELQEVRVRESALVEAHQKLVAARETLESQVAGQLRTVTGICQAARLLERQDPQQVLQGATELVAAVLNPEKFSIFLVDGRELKVSRERGWTAGDSYSRTLSRDSLLFQEVIGRRRWLCSPDAASAKALDGEGVLAGPLIDDQCGEVVGMLQIEELGFLDLTIAAVQKFRALSEWIGTAYGSALRYRDACREREHA